MKYFFAVCNPNIRVDESGRSPATIGVYEWFRHYEKEWGVSDTNNVAINAVQKVSPRDQILFYVIAPWKKVIALFQSDSFAMATQNPSWKWWLNISPLKIAAEYQGVPLSRLPQRIRKKIHRHSFFELEPKEFEIISELLS